MAKLNYVDYIALILVVVGAINWGLVGAVEYNLVTKIASILPTYAAHIERVVYILVGLAGLYTAALTLHLQKS